MAAQLGHVDPSNTTEDVTSQPILEISSSNYWVQHDVLKYPYELKMLIVALNHSFLSTIMDASFSVTMIRLYVAGSTTVFNKTSKVVMFQLTNDMTYKLTKKKFS